LGWSPPDNREIYTLAELEAIFDVSGISKSPSVFDMTKLRWVNGQYLAAMDFEAFYALAQPYVKDKALAALVQSRVSTLEEIPEMLAFIDVLPEYDTLLFVHKKSKCDETVAADVLARILPEIEAYDGEWAGPALYAFMTQFAEKNGLKNLQVLWPMRVALAGLPATPGGASDLLVILGREESLRRINIALGKLGVAGHAPQ